MLKLLFAICFLSIIFSGCRNEDHLIFDVNKTDVQIDFQSREISSCPPTADFPLALHDIVPAQNLSSDCLGSYSGTSLLEKYYDCLFNTPDFTEDHSCHTILRFPLFEYCKEVLQDGNTEYKMFPWWNGLNSDNIYFFTATGTSPGDDVFTEVDVQFMAIAAKTFVEELFSDPGFSFDFMDLDFFLEHDSCSDHCLTCETEINNSNNVETLICENGPTVMVAFRFCDIYEGGDDGEG